VLKHGIMQNHNAGCVERTLVYLAMKLVIADVINVDVTVAVEPDPAVPA
jgi:hypothetical protein